jgi:tetraprenyl-beta-curcumene synthase
VHHSHRSYTGASAAANAAGALALADVGAAYWLRIHPHARRELAAWEQRASGIRDPDLRRQALCKLTVERLNPEAAALFAVLAPRAQRQRVVALIVAYQVLYDYLDAVNEQVDGCGLLNGLQLHQALTDAVLPSLPIGDYYRHHPRHADDGYLRGLTERCRQIARSLPSLGRLARVLTRATERCAQAQSRNHAIGVSGERQLAEWSLAQAPDGGGYEWWELAAGGISCLGIHALLARAADTAVTEREAMAVDAAYFPPICALSALLDSLADFDADAGTANHRFVAHYRDAGHASKRLASIASDAREQVARLRHGRRHAVILEGIASYYLSCASVREGFAAEAAESLVRSGGSLARPMRTAMRMRRYAHGLAERSPTATATRGAAAIPEARAARARAKRRRLAQRAR